MPQAGVPGKAGFPRKEEHLKRKRRTIYANEAEYKSLKAHLEELRKSSVKTD